MNDRPPQPQSPISELFGAKDLLNLVVQKLSSQALLFGVGIIIIVVATAWLFQKQPNGGLPIILTVLFVFVVVFVGYLFIEQKGKLERGDPETTKQVMQHQMGAIESSSESFKVELWTSTVGAAASGARDVNVAPTAGNASYRVGEKIAVHFRATRDCYVTLLNIGTSGRLAVLFPNSVRRDNFVPAGHEIVIPGPDYGFEYEISGPPGTEKLKAIATLQKTELLESSFAPDGSFFRTVDAPTGARDIVTIKKKVEAIPALEWAEAGYEFRTA